MSFPVKMFFQALVWCVVAMFTSWWSLPLLGRAILALLLGVYMFGVYRSLALLWCGVCFLAGKGYDHLGDWKAVIRGWIDQMLRPPSPDPLMQALRAAHQRLSAERRFRLRRLLPLIVSENKTEEAQVVACPKPLENLLSFSPNYKDWNLIEICAAGCALVGAAVLAIAAVWLAWRILCCFCSLLRRVWVYPYREAFATAKVEYLPESIPERVLPGSTFINMEAPSGQAEVYVDLNGTGLTRMGQCFRVDDYLLTAMHCLSNATAIHIKTKSGTVKVDPGCVKDLTNDIAAIELEEAQMAKLGLKKLKLSDTLIDQRTYANVHGLGKQSGGHVQRSKEHPGEILFGGSTLPGFSGAPYLYGQSMVIGLHLAGGSQNMGISAPYLAWFIRKLNGRRNESSEDWIIDQAVRHMSRVDRTSTPGEYLVEINNKIYDLNEDQYQRIANGRRKLNFRNPETLEEVLPPTDLGSENLRGAPATAGAPGEPSSQRVSVLQLRSTSPQDQESDSTDSPPWDLGGQKLTRVQLKGLLENMSQLLAAPTRNRNNKKSRTPNSAQSKSTSPGQDPPAQ